MSKIPPAGMKYLSFYGGTFLCANKRSPHCLPLTCKTPPLPVTLNALRIVTFQHCSAQGLVRRIVLDINVRKRSQVQVIQLRGALRMGPAVDTLRQTFEEALGSGDTRIVMNLSEVPMVDSSGIGVLVRFLALIKQKGGNIKLSQPSKFAVQTLRLVGVLNLFEIFDNDDAAVESFV